MPLKNKFLGNPLLSFLGLLFRTNIKDFHCGLRAISKSCFDSLDFRTTGMEFASEMVVRASEAQKNISEVPTTLSIDKRTRKPHLRPWRDGWRHLKVMLLMSPNWLFLGPGVICFLASLVCYFLTFSDLLVVGDVRCGPLSMIFFQTGAILGLVLIGLNYFINTLSMEFGLKSKTSFIRYA